MKTSNPSADVMIAIAAFHLKYGEAENARDLLKSALFIDPNEQRALRLLAIAHLKCGDGLSAEFLTNRLERKQGKALNGKSWGLIKAVALRVTGKPEMARSLFWKQSEG